MPVNGYQETQSDERGKTEGVLLGSHQQPAGKLMTQDRLEYKKGFGEKHRRCTVYYRVPYLLHIQS